MKNDKVKLICYDDVILEIPMLDLKNNVYNIKKNFAKELENSLANQKWRYLNSGGFSSVYVKDGKDYVIKISRSDAANYFWLKKCLQMRNNKHIPFVHAIHFISNFSEQEIIDGFDRHGDYFHFKNKFPFFHISFMEKLENNYKEYNKVYDYISPYGDKKRFKNSMYELQLANNALKSVKTDINCFTDFSSTNCLFSIKKQSIVLNDPLA
jgi:hypothetical protein